jgi:hypothetical protein
MSMWMWARMWMWMRWAQRAPVRPRMSARPPARGHDGLIGIRGSSHGAHAAALLLNCEDGSFGIDGHPAR